MRVRLLIDIETDDLDRLQRYVGEQPVVEVRTIGVYGPDEPWATAGRFVGAKEAIDGVAEVATARDRSS